MKTNRNGITLLEMLVVLVILGIIVQFLGTLFLGANRTIERLRKATVAAQTAQAAGSLKLKWTDKAIAGAEQPLLCFTGNAVYSCLPLGCTFQQTIWYEGGHKCTGGILYQ